jgi:hypothetical protein
MCIIRFVKLSYIIIVPFGPFTLIVKCVFVSLFKNVLLKRSCVEMCLAETQYVICFEIAI